MRRISEQTVGCRADTLIRFLRGIGLIRILGGILFFALLHSPAQAVQSVTLAWDKSPDLSVVGYRMYSGVTSGNYSNSVVVGNVTTNTVPGLTSGVTYFFAITAYDTSGLESVFSNEVGYTVPLSNSLPTIALTSPANGANYTSPATINLAVSVTANGHTISKVQFYNGALLLGEDTSAPYSSTWSNVTAGSYSLTARAMYDAGSTVTSSAASVTVANPTLAPTIALTAPLSGARYAVPATISLAASVTANGHTLTKVQFYNGATLLGEDASVPYSVTWSNVSAGSYSLTARVVYDTISTVSSPPVSIAVTGLPPPWQTADIGVAGASGSASLSNGIYTVKGAGNVSGRTDNFRFLYQVLTSDGEIKVRLNSVSDTGTSARIGVMIRESLTSSSKYAFMGIPPNGTFRWQRRRDTGGSTSAMTSTIGTLPNAWVRLVRTGNTLTGYRSTDGVKWTQVNSRSITMATSIYVGLAVASGSSNTLNTATFSNTTVVP